MDARLIAAVSGCGEDLNVAGLCRQLGISRQSFYKWRARYLVEGLEGLQERSRRPKRSPRRTAVWFEEVVVEYRKKLIDQGLDAGASTIHWHLCRDGTFKPPSEATIWRILVRRGFVTATPSKRPKGSLRRFEADRPNERWQVDHTEWILADGTGVQILNIIDDHSRLCVASVAAATVTSGMLWDSFETAGRRWGWPSSCLSDNGLVFSGKLRGFEVEFEKRLRTTGIVAITSRPFHPQTCGKVERFQQTLKKWLAARRRHLVTIGLLNHSLDDFADYYNHQRPHRGIGRATPYSRWAAQPPATANPQPLPPRPRPIDAATVRSERKVIAGNVHYGNHIIRIGAQHEGRTAHLVIRSGDHLALYIDEQLVRTLIIDPTRRYQPWRPHPPDPQQPHRASPGR
ncbi:MAG TPA: leucine zipper domain-containing protein [Acidimicrobiales bacterium]|nr:leucine zipper domain-containing protein [Acidimicrobiales bacterium]